MFQLGFPELVLGDCHKALLLLEAAQKRDSVLSDQVNLYFGMKIWIQEQQDLYWPITEWPSELWRFRIQTRLNDVESESLICLSLGLLFSNCVADCVDLCRRGIENFPRWNISERILIRSNRLGNASSSKMSRQSTTA